MEEMRKSWNSTAIHSMWETLGLKVAKLGLKDSVVGVHLTYLR